MRGVLVLIGLLIGLVVAFLAAWPQLVEVPALREQIAALIKELVGSELRLEGAVRLELLPRPRVTIERAVIGDRVAVGPGPRFSADRIDIDLAVLPLLTGRLEPRGLQLVRPTLILADPVAAAPARLLAVLITGPAAKVDRVDMVDGSVELSGAPPLTVDAIDLDLVRDATGALSIEASMAAAGEPLRVKAQGGPLVLDQPMPLTLAAEAGPEAEATSLSFSGHLRVSRDGTSAEGRVGVDAGHGRLPGWLGGEPWPAAALQGRLSADAQSLRLAELVLTLPEGELHGAATVALDRAMPLELTLSGTSLEMSPGMIRSLDRIVGAAGQGQAGAGTVRVDIASLVWGGGQVRRLAVEAAWSTDDLDVRKVDAVLPGQTALNWRGSGPRPPGSPLDGTLAVQSGDLRGLLAWLGSDPASLPRGGLTSLDLTAQASAGRDRLALANLAARLDASTLAGSAVVDTGARPRIDLDLRIDRLNTALYAPWPEAWPRWRPTLEALDGSLALRVDQISHDVLRGRELLLQGTLDAGRLDLTALRLADLAGASVDLAGVVDLPLAAWDVSGSMALARTAPLQRLLGIAAPLALDRFAPLRLAASSRREAGVTTADLSLAGTGVNASLRGRLAGDPGDGALALTVAADVAETADVLAALGWPAPPEAPGFGRLSTEVTLSREDGPVLARIAAAVGADRLQGEVTIATDGARPRLAGSLELAGLDAGLSSAVYRTLAIPLRFPPGDPWLWPGVWPGQPMSWRWLNAVDLELKVSASRLTDGAEEIGDAGFTVELADGDLDLRDLSLPLAGGLLSGTATLEGRGDLAVLGAELRLEDARVEELAMSAAAGSAIAGELDLHASLLGEGRSIADIVRTLSGEGRLALPRSNLPDLGLEGLSLDGAFTLESGVLAAPLKLSYPGGQGSLDLRLDLPAWILSATLELAGMRRNFIGPPGRIAPAGSDTPAP